MKKTFALLLITGFTILCGCTQKAKEKEADDADKSLYDQVMAIHDEVMPGMDELYTLKRRLSKKIENSPDLVEEKRKQIESTVLLIDSASRGMMRWMNEFSPEDYSGDDLQKYLENELERVTVVKETMLEALKQGRKANE